MRGFNRLGLLVAAACLLLIAGLPVNAETLSFGTWASATISELQSERQILLDKQQNAQNAKNRAEAARRYAVQLNDQPALAVAGQAIAAADTALKHLALALSHIEQRATAMQTLEAAGDKAPRAVVSRMRGEVKIHTRRGWKSLDPQRQITPGEIIRTGKDGYIELIFNDGSTINLDANTSLVLDSVDAETSNYRLLLGRIKANIKRLNRRRYRIRTPTAVLGVRGTEFIVESDGAGASAVVVLEGEISFAAIDSEESTVIRAGEFSAVRADGTLTAATKIDVSRLQNWWQ